MKNRTNLNLHSNKITFKNRLLRLLWTIVFCFLYKPSPIVFHSWRRMLLRIFGAKIGSPIYIYPSARVWAPWNLEMGNHSTLAQHVDCYNVAKIKIGSYTTVSQYCFLCTATHDYSDSAILSQPQMPLLTAPIVLGDRVWITADVFVGPGVSVGDGTVVLSRSTVTKALPAWVIAQGFPAIAIKPRILTR